MPNLSKSDLLVFSNAQVRTRSYSHVELWPHQLKRPLDSSRTPSASPLTQNILCQFPAREPNNHGRPRTRPPNCGFDRRAVTFVLSEFISKPPTAPLRYGS